ncbi:MAG: hypothetical protein K2X48_07615 [Chitinophagaceae bacterium]|nr:hypothetical protein [Chitinophagaceae bacterium]
MKKGSRGEEVKNLQRAFNFSARYYGGKNVLVEDGVFGSKTQAELSKRFANASSVDEARYNWIMNRMNQGIPVARVYVQDNQWPLQITNHDDGKSRLRRIRNLNIALGVYRSNTNDAKAAEFGINTYVALRDKYKATKVDEQLYYEITGQFAPIMPFGL